MAVNQWTLSETKKLSHVFIHLMFFINNGLQIQGQNTAWLTGKCEVLKLSSSISINPSSELYSEALTDDAAEVDSLYQ